MKLQNPCFVKILGLIGIKLFFTRWRQYNLIFLLGIAGITWSDKASRAFKLTS
ncbi:MAG: hypothetical protein ABI180_13450 [Microcoleus sp.]|jgi:hypothetical protein